MMNSTIDDYITLARDKTTEHNNAHKAYVAACQHRIDGLDDANDKERSVLLGKIAASYASYAQSVSALALVLAVADRG